MQSSSMPCGFTSPSFKGWTRGLSEKANVNLSGMTSLSVGESLPARMRDVEDHLIGAGPLHFKVAVASGSHVDVQTGLLGEPLGLDGLQLLTGIVEIFHLEAEVVDAVVVGPVGSHVGVFLRLPVQNRQVDVAVGQEYRAARAAADLLQSEAFLVKRRDRVGVLRGQRDVPDPRHDVPSCSAHRDCVTVSMSAGLLFSFTTVRPLASAGRISSVSRMGPSPYMRKLFASATPIATPIPVPVPPPPAMYRAPSRTSQSLRSQPLSDPCARTQSWSRIVSQISADSRAVAMGFCDHQRSFRSFWTRVATAVWISRALAALSATRRCRSPSSALWHRRASSRSTGGPLPRMAISAVTSRP